MTGKELYEKYKGRKAKDGPSIEGIICGYCKDLMILAVTKGIGWLKQQYDDTIVTHQNNDLGYWYVLDSNVLPEEKKNNKTSIQ